MIESLKFTYVIGVFIILNGKSNSLRINDSDNTTSDYRLKTSAVSLSRTQSKLSGKWEVGRVSRKQYEIINMLHRKRKTFVESTSMDVSIKHRKILSKNSQHITLVAQNPIQESFQVVHSRANDRSLTPSYIEFYYLDDSDDRIKHKDAILKRSRTDIQNDEHKTALLRPPFFLFRVNDATCKSATLNYIPSFLNNKKFSTYNSTRVEAASHTETSNNNLNKGLINKYIQGDYTPRMSVNKTEKRHKTNITENENFPSLLRDRFTRYISTTPYDRVKFFELYDSDTYKPHTVEDNKINKINDYTIQSKEKLYLDQVDHDTGNHNGHNITRFVKKHVNFDFKENKNINGPGANRDKNNIWTPAKISRKSLTKFSRPAKWSEFPFIAVYVYEPTQIRCDSASISPHWLVASAACLHSNRKSLKTEGTSAFVAYCGDNWRVPGRIAYVKRSFIHPRFQSKNKTRRYLYNIGVIQVGSSMANTCHGWRPVYLMSHQFVANREGSFATAVGWGLDRYDTRYSSDLPSYPLMLYESLVYSDTCPGNADYSKVKRLNDDVMKNVYCLSLPPYTVEENDTVHGGLLLIGGKLIALYLQEERRPRGDQSAQYTGIWRLIPWLLDVAHEVEELNPLRYQIR